MESRNVNHLYKKQITPKPTKSFGLAQDDNAVSFRPR